MVAHEHEAHLLMEALNVHLRAEDALDVIREERYLHRVRNPEPFMGLEPKNDQ